MNCTLEVNEVSKSYGKKLALNNVSLEIGEGEIHGLLGPNGAGKTTLVKIIATLLQKDSGTVRILGLDISENENLVRHLMGYVGQDTERSMYARLTPIENLRFFGALRGLSRKDVDERIDVLSSKFGMEQDVLEKQFMHLSGGQKQSIVIIRSMLHDAPLLLLDEPTKGLDPIAANRIRNFLKDYATREKKSILLTSHIMPEVDFLADRCSLINRGEIHVSGTPHELKQSVGATEFIELNASAIGDDLLSKIQQMDQVLVTTVRNGGEERWYSFGVTDIFEGMEGIINVLRSEGVRTAIRHHSISLEDAFIHHIGKFKDEEEESR